MKKLIPLLILLVMLSACAAAQTQPYGIIDTADLTMTSCAFEKDANAMILFDAAVVNYDYSTIVTLRHKRIKIFNDNGKDEANIRIEYYGVDHVEDIKDIQAETINLNNKTISYTTIDKKSIFTEVVDKEKKAIVLSFPNVKPGSIIEFEYKLITPNLFNYPNWFFQSSIPSRYSEFNAGFIENYKFTVIKKLFQPLALGSAVLQNDTKTANHIWALANIKSYPQEAYMDYPDDYVQCILVHRLGWDRTWAAVVNDLLNDEDFGLQLYKKLSNENEIITKANLYKTDDEKIAFIFNAVKNTIKWNKKDLWFTVDGVKKAWDKKREIQLKST